jgi:hypothetical protein
MVIGTAVAPCETERELAESVIAKSGGGVEDGGLTFDDGVPAPPQPAPTHSKVTTALLDARFHQLRTLGCSARAALFLDSKSQFVIIEIINILG